MGHRTRSVLAFALVLAFLLPGLLYLVPASALPGPAVGASFLPDTGRHTNVYWQQQCTGNATGIGNCTPTAPNASESYGDFSCPDCGYGYGPTAFGTFFNSSQPLPGFTSTWQYLPFGENGSWTNISYETGLPETQTFYAPGGYINGFTANDTVAYAPTCSDYVPPGSGGGPSLYSDLPYGGFVGLSLAGTTQGEYINGTSTYAIGDYFEFQSLDPGYGVWFNGTPLQLNNVLYHHAGPGSYDGTMPLISTCQIAFVPSLGSQGDYLACVGATVSGVSPVSELLFLEYDPVLGTWTNVTSTVVGSATGNSDCGFMADASGTGLTILFNGVSFYYFDTTTGNFQPYSVTGLSHFNALTGWIGGQYCGDGGGYSNIDSGVLFYGSCNGGPSNAWLFTGTATSGSIDLLNQTVPYPGSRFYQDGSQNLTLGFGQPMIIGGVNTTHSYPYGDVWVGGFALYNITFVTNGLGPGQPWSVNVSGVLNYSSLSSSLVTRGLLGGTYFYFVPPVGNFFAIPSAASLFLTHNTTITIYFGSRLPAPVITSVSIFGSAMVVNLLMPYVFRGLDESIYNLTNATVYFAPLGLPEYLLNYSWNSTQHLPADGINWQASTQIYLYGLIPGVLYSFNATCWNVTGVGAVSNTVFERTPGPPNNGPFPPVIPRVGKNSTAPFGNVSAPPNPLYTIVVLNLVNYTAGSSGLDTSTASWANNRGVIFDYEFALQAAWLADATQVNVSADGVKLTPTTQYGVGATVIYVFPGVAAVSPNATVSFSVTFVYNPPSPLSGGIILNGAGVSTAELFAIASFLIVAVVAFFALVLKKTSIYSVIGVTVFCLALGVQLFA